MYSTYIMVRFREATSMTHTAHMIMLRGIVSRSRAFLDRLAENSVDVVFKRLFA